MFTSVTRSNVNSNKKLTKAHKALEWYHYHSEAAMGWKSNFSSIVRAWIFKTKKENEETQDIEDQLISIIDSQKTRFNPIEAAGRQRKIFEAYQALSPKHQNIIAAYFEEKQTDLDPKFLFDSKIYVTTVKDKEIELDGLVPGIRLLAWSTTAQTIPDFSLSWLKKAQKKDIVKFNQIREEADALYFTALKAFSKNFI